jgi:hypothetical protein
LARFRTSQAAIETGACLSIARRGCTKRCPLRSKQRQLDLVGAVRTFCLEMMAGHV